MNFEPFPKVPRLSRECLVTEKIDGTNGTVYVQDVTGEPWTDSVSAGEETTGAPTRPPGVLVDLYDDGLFLVASASRKDWITPERDNHGFARWVRENAADLAGLGEGWHRGEWWGSGIQRGYGLQKGEKRFSLFNANRWYDTHGHAGWVEERPEGAEPAPGCCHVVPVLWRGEFDTRVVADIVEAMRTVGSAAAPFDRPEGVMVYHVAAGAYFKKTLVDDEKPKGQA